MVPETMEGVGTSQLATLATKLTVLMTSNGIAARNIDDAVVVYPVLKIYDEREIPPGRQKMTLIDEEPTLVVTQTSGRAMFASLNRKVKGSGRSHDQAVNHIIAAIKTHLMIASLLCVRRSLLTSLLLGTLVLGSYKKSEDVAPAVEASQLVGSWRMSTSRVIIKDRTNGNPVSIDQSRHGTTDEVLTFAANGSVTDPSDLFGTSTSR